MYPDGLAAVKLGKILGVPVVISARGTDVNSFTQMKAIRPLVLEAANGASAVISVSRGIADRLCQLGVPASRIHVIRNGVDAKSFHPRDRSAARDRLGIPADTRMLLCVSSLVEAKGHLVLLEALSMLRASGRRDPRLVLYIVGEGALRKKMERTVRKLGLEGAVHLCGRQAEELMPWWYSAADLAVHPSFSEGCPNAVLEALSCGTPVVASGVGEIPRLVQEDRAGFLVAPGDPRELADALGRALKATWDRSLIQESVKALTWDAVARELEDVYRTVSRSPG